MDCIIANTCNGGKELYFGIPNLECATVVDVKTKQTKDCYETRLIMKTAKGSEFNLFIRQERRC